VTNDTGRHPRLEQVVIIQLTEEQVQAVAASGDVPPTLVDPHTQTNYVLVRKDLYERMTSEEYDDSPWTAEERDLLAWEAGNHAGWDEMSEHDDVTEKPRSAAMSSLSAFRTALVRAERSARPWSCSLMPTIGPSRL
jgi:hypothetical protein